MSLRLRCQNRSQQCPAIVASDVLKKFDKRHQLAQTLIRVGLYINPLANLPRSSPASSVPYSNPLANPPCSSPTSLVLYLNPLANPSRSSPASSVPYSTLLAANPAANQLPGRLDRRPPHRPLRHRRQAHRVQAPLHRIHRHRDPHSVGRLLWLQRGECVLVPGPHALAGHHCAHHDERDGIGCLVRAHGVCALADDIEGGAAV
jgi:hypothetical protein